MQEDHNVTKNFLGSENDVFCVISVDGHFSYFNDAAPKFFCCTAEEIKEKTIFDLMSPLDIERTKQAFQKAVEGTPDTIENRFGPEEKPCWVSWNIFHAEGLIYAIGRDVTSVYEDRETLQTAQNRLRLLHQATSNPNQTLGEKIERVLNLGNLQLGMQTAVVSYIKEGSYSIVRAKSDDPRYVKGKEFDIKQTFDGIVLNAGNLVGIQDIKNSVYDEHPAHTATKFESYIAIPLYVDGEISGVLSFAGNEAQPKEFEITDYDFVRLVGQWVSSSLALLFANEQIAYTAAIVGSSEDAIIGQDRNGLITTWNQGAEKLLQYSAEEIIGKHFSILIPDEKKEEADRILGELLKGESLEHYDSFRKKKDATFVDVSVTVSPILNEEKQIVGASSVLRDITREKEIDKAKTEFVSLASHQLRTPLSAINWYAELLRDGEAGKMSKQQKEFVDEIFIGNQRMVRLVNELLNVSRVDFGNFSIDPVEIDILEISRSVVKELVPVISKKKLNVSEIYEEKTLMYLADPNILRIVIQNLVSNAVKYTPEKGKVIVKIEKQTVAKRLLIEVSDTGFGIPENQQERIFSKLFRADNVQEMDTVGTGLGLYVLKSIVEESGGSVTFDSTEGEGTTFTVLLPLSGMKKKEGGKSLSQVTP